MFPDSQFAKSFSQGKIKISYNVNYEIAPYLKKKLIYSMMFEIYPFVLSLMKPLTSKLKSNMMLICTTGPEIMMKLLILTVVLYLSDIVPVTTL